MSRQRFVALAVPGSNDDLTEYPIVLTPQFEWKNYRIDFAIRGPNMRFVFVECDGHDFHERTKEQAARDRAKDRAAQLDGIPIMRFTGSEIWRNPVGCGADVLNMVAEQLK